MRDPGPILTPRTAPEAVPAVRHADDFDVAASFVKAILRAAGERCWNALEDRAERIPDDAAAAARWAARMGRQTVYGATVVAFAVLRVPRALARSLALSPARRPWYAVYPEDWPATTDWLVAPKYAAGRDDVCIPMPAAEAFALGRTLPRKATPERWAEPLRQAWLAAHTKRVWVPAHRRYCHVLILGGPGTGKTSRWVLLGLTRDLVWGRGQILTVDAKGGEQYRTLAPAARRAGVHALCLDPYDAAHTAAIEPLGSATPGELEVLAEALYGGAASRATADEFWDAYAKSYLRFLLTLVALFPRASRAVPCVAWLATEETPRVTQLADALLDHYRDPERVARHAADAVLTLARVDDATLADARGRPAAISAALAVVEFLPLPVQRALRVLRARVARGGTLTRDDAEHVAAVTRTSVREHWERLAAARRQIRELERPGNEKLAGSTRATLAAHLRTFTLPEVARFFSRPEVDLWTFAAAPQRRLLCVGARVGQGAAAAQVATLIAELAIRSVYTRNTLPDDHPVKQRPVWIYLDEVAQLNLRELPRHLALVRSMNAGIVLAAQDLSQLRVLYGEMATAVETSCATVVPLDRLEDATAARYAERLGPVEIVRRVPSTSRDRRWDEQRDVRNRLEPADLRVRRINGQIRRDAAFQAQGAPFWFARPAPYYEDPVVREELGLVQSGGRWVPSEELPPEREAAEGETPTSPPDPYAETVLALVGVPPDIPRPALTIPAVPWPAFGIEDEDGPARVGRWGASPPARLAQPPARPPYYTRHGHLSSVGEGPLAGARRARHVGARARRVPDR